MPKLTKGRSSAKNASEKAKNIPPKAKLTKIKKTQETVHARSKIRDNRKRLLTIIEDINNSSETLVACPHYLIGAASFQKLMTGVYNLTKSHQHLLPKEQTDDYFWQVGEKHSEKSHTGDMKQPLRIHPYIPFLCAKADIYSPQHKFIVETKSTESESELAKYANVIPRPVLIQMLMTMECFDVEEGRLYVQMFTPLGTSKKKTFCRKYQYILTKEKHIRLVDDDDIPLVVERYLKYFKYYVLEAGIKLSPSLEDEARKLFIKNIRDKKWLYDRLKGERTEEINIREEKIKEVCIKYGAQPKKSSDKSYSGEMIEPEEINKAGFKNAYYNYDLYQEIFTSIAHKTFAFDAKQKARIYRSMNISLQKRLKIYEESGLLEGKDVNYSVLTASLAISLKDEEEKDENAI